MTPEPPAVPGRGHPTGPHLTRRTFLRGTLLGAAAAAGLPVLSACARDSGTPSGTGTAGPSGLQIASPQSPVLWPIADDNKPIAAGQQPEPNATLQLYNYADYIDPEALKSFEAKYKSAGVKVAVTTFNDQSEALAKIRTGSVPFDVYFPSYDIIGKIVTAGLARPLQQAYVPNIANVWPEFTNPFYDQQWRYSVPYTVYTTGIGWRTDKVSEDVGARPNPWDVFWDTKYTNQMAVLDDYRETIGMALLRKGIDDLNTGNQQDLDVAKQELLQLNATTKPKVTITGYTDLPEGRLSISHMWSGDIVNAQYYLPKGVEPSILRYWFPKDGKGPVNNDLMMVMRGGKNPVLAHLFLDHMLDYEVAKGNFGAIGYQPPQTRITPEALVKDEFLPPTLASATVLPGYFDVGYRTLELPPAVDAQWQAVWQQFNAGA